MSNVDARASNVVSGGDALLALFETLAGNGTLRVSGGFAPTISQTDVRDVLATANAGDGVAYLTIPALGHVDVATAARLAERMIAEMVADWTGHPEILEAVNDGRMRIFAHTAMVAESDKPKAKRIRQSLALLVVAPETYWTGLGLPARPTSGILAGAVKRAFAEIRALNAKLQKQNAKTIDAAATPVVPSLGASLRAAMDRARIEDHGTVPTAPAGAE